MKTYLTYAAYAGLANAVFNLVLYVTDLQSTNMALGQHAQWLGMIITTAILFLGMREARNNAPRNKDFGYGKAFLACFLISVFSSLFVAVYNFIHFTWINPNFAQYLADFTRQSMEAKNVPDAQIDAILQGQAMFMKPAFMAIANIFGTILFGTLIGLILAIFGRRNAAHHKGEPTPVPTE